VTKLGGYAVLEPTTLEDDSDKRPDIEAIIAGKRYLIDVTVIHPTAVSNATHAATRPLASASKAANAKVKKYAEMTRRCKAIFVPFAVETYGGICDQGNAFVRDLIKLSSAHQVVWQPSEVVYTIRHAIAVALQVGNARAVAASLAGSWKE
jgi:hypothetical protein